VDPGSDRKGEPSGMTSIDCEYVPVNPLGHSRD